MTAPWGGGVRGDDRGMTDATVSRIVLFIPEPDLQGTVAALAAAADTEAVWTDMVRRDGSTSPQGSVTVGGTVIEVSAGDVAAPAVIELRVPDPDAAAERAAEASGFELAGTRVVGPALTIALRSA